MEAAEERNIGEDALQGFQDRLLRHDMGGKDTASMCKLRFPTYTNSDVRQFTDHSWKSPVCQELSPAAAFNNREQL